MGSRRAPLPASEASLSQEINGLAECLARCREQVDIPRRHGSRRRTAGKIFPGFLMAEIYERLKKEAGGRQDRRLGYGTDDDIIRGEVHNRGPKGFQGNAGLEKPR